MIHEKDIELIERFLKEELSPWDRRAFENRLQLEPELKKALAEEETILSQFDLVDFDFIENLNDVIDEGRSNHESSSNFTKWIIVALLALLSAAAILYVNTKEEQVDHDILFAQNFEPYPMLLTNRGIGVEHTLNFVNAYNRLDWENARNQLEQHGIGDMPRELHDIYMAVILLGLDESEKSLSYLTPYENESVIYKETILWFSALAYLKQDQNENCLMSLDKLLTISSESSDLYQKAIKLKDELTD